MAWLEWLQQYWPVPFAAGAVVALALAWRLVAARRRPRPRHTGDRTIRVVGVGGAGGNAVDDMIESNVDGADFLVINTDGQVLEQSIATRRVRIGDQVTHGLGTGGDPEVGRRAAEEDAEAIRAALEGADLIFVAAGLGGGTGSGAGPLIAATARELGALTVGVVTLPFGFEGPLRRQVAETAAKEMLGSVDTLLVIENDRASGLVTEETTLRDAFATINQVLAQAVRGVADIMTVPGLVNVDFADVRTIMRDGGIGLAGIGRASGEGRAVTAATAATTSPLLTRDMRGAQRILLHVAGSSRLTLREVVDAAETVREAAGADARVIFGATFDDRLKDDMWVTVIATGFADTADAHRERTDEPAKRTRRERGAARVAEPAPSEAGVP